MRTVGTQGFAVGAVRQPARIGAEESSYIARLLKKSYLYLLQSFETFKPATRVQIALELVKRRLPLEVMHTGDQPPLILVRMGTNTNTTSGANINATMERAALNILRAGVDSTQTVDDVHTVAAARTPRLTRTRRIKPPSSTVRGGVGGGGDGLRGLVALAVPRPPPASAPPSGRTGG